MHFELELNSCIFKGLAWLLLNCPPPPVLTFERYKNKKAMFYFIFYFFQALAGPYLYPAGLLQPLLDLTYFLFLFSGFSDCQEIYWKQPEFLFRSR